VGFYAVTSCSTDFHPKFVLTGGGAIILNTQRNAGRSAEAGVRVDPVDPRGRLPERLCHDRPIQVMIYDEIHSQERFILTVMPHR
jgi:hypothetical protein